jgi:hypothetical protein
MKEKWTGKNVVNLSLPLNLVKINSWKIPNHP